MTLTLDQLGSLAPPQAQPAAPQAGVLTLDQLGSLAPQQGGLAGVGAGLSNMGGALASGAVNFANAATLGYAPNIAAGLTAVPNLVTGGAVGPDYQTALGRITRGNNQLTEAHPIAGAIGTVGGMLGGGAAELRGLEALGRASVPVASAAATKVLGLLTPASGASTIAKVGRMAAGGAILNAANEVAQTRSISGDTAIAAGIGGVLGPVAGIAVPPLLKLGQRGYNFLGEAIGQLPSGNAAAQAANKAFSKILGKMDPAAAETVINNLSSQGMKPSIAMSIADQPGAQNAVLGAANNNPILAQQLLAHQNQIAQEAPKLLQGKVADVAGPQAVPGVAHSDIMATPGIDTPRVQDINSLKTKRTEMMDAAIAPIEGSMVSIPRDIFSDPDIQSAIGALDSGAKGSLREVFNAAEAAKTDVSIPVKVAEAVRRRLGELSDTGSVVGQKYSALKDSLEATAAGQVPAYGAALDQFRTNSNYIRGFEHSEGGGTLGSASDRLVASSLAKPEGLAGYASGHAARLAGAANASNAGAARLASALGEESALTDAAKQALGSARTQPIAEAAAASDSARRSLEGATPSRVQPAPHTPGEDLVAAGAAGLSGLHITALANARHWLASVIGKGIMSPEVQTKVAQMITSRDPAVIAQSIAVLKRAGLDTQTINRLQQLLAAQGAPAIANTIMPIQ